MRKGEHGRVRLVPAALVEPTPAHEALLKGVKGQGVSRKILGPDNLL